MNNFNEIYSIMYYLDIINCNNIVLKTKKDRFGGVRIPKEILEKAKKELEANKDLKDMGFHTVGGWATYLLQRELDRYCKDSNSKS